METIRVPTAIEDIDASFLTEALSRGRPGVEVTAAQIGTVILGTASKVRFMLEYNREGHKHRLPPTLWLKAGIGRPYSDVIGDLYTNEALFYADFAPQIKDVLLPKCYFAGVAEDGSDGVLLLEDLLSQNVEFCDTWPISVDIAAAMMDVQAAYHGIWWDRPELKKLPRSLDVALNVGIDYYFGENDWAVTMAKPYAANMPQVLKSSEGMTHAVRRLLELAKESPDTLCHGDSHVANSFVTLDGTPGYLDWQLAGRFAHMADVTNYLVTSLSIEDRRANEQALLRQYHQALTARCKDAPSFDNLWLNHRRFALHPLNWVAVSESQQPVRRTAAITERAIAAVEDLETLKALGVSG